MLLRRTCSLNVMKMRQFSNNFTPESLLSDENRKKTVEKFSKTRVPMQLPSKPVRHAAVLIPICIVDQQVSLLYTRRAPNLKQNAGQVCFPGGMTDQDYDKNEIDTALRETEEELGLKAADIEIWGCGNPVMNTRKINVVPVIGCVRNELSLEQLKVNPSEVQDVFTVTIRDLCNPKLQTHTQFSGGYSLPAFMCGKRKIWGLTAVITSMFLTAFVPDNVYKHQVKFINKL